MGKYYFIDKEIYFNGEKMPDRKVQLYNVSIGQKTVKGEDEDGNCYEIAADELIIE